MRNYSVLVTILLLPIIMDAYNAFVRNFQEIKGLNLLPVRMKLEDNGLGLMNHQAKWHKH